MGSALRAEAQRALQNKLARLLPGGRSATMTLGEWVAEYLDTHQGERVTIAKLHWLLGKATAALGEVRLAELSGAGLRMAAHCSGRAPVRGDPGPAAGVDRAVSWKLIDENTAKEVRIPAVLPGTVSVQVRQNRWLTRPARADVLGRQSCSRPQRGFDPPSYSRSNIGDIDRAAGVLQIRREMRTDASSTPRRGSAGARFRCRRSRSTRSTNSGRGKTACCSSPTRARLPRLPQLQSSSLEANSEGGSGSSRCATSTICATPTPRSRSVPACPSSTSHASWARASR